MHPLRLAQAFIGRGGLQPASFSAPLLTSLVLDRGTGSPTFTRATTKTFTDWEGRVRTAVSGEACFTGARRVQNLLNATEAMAGANWTTSNAGAGSVATCTSGFTAPDGTATAFRVQANRGANTAGDISTWVNLGASGIGLTANSVWIKSNTGLNQNVLLSLAAANAGDVIVATPTWQRLATLPKTYAILTANAFAVGTRGTTGSDLAIDVLVWRPQMETITGQSNVAPGEYVSVGVLSAPFQGAGVDGVQYFATQNGNTVTANVVTAGTGAPLGLTKQQNAYLAGTTASDRFDTPNSAANTITGSLSLRVYLAPGVWPPTAEGTILGKWTGASNLCYALNLLGTGALKFYITTGGTGATQLAATSSVVVAGGAGVEVGVRADYDQTSGNVTFYTSTDPAGVVWTQLGTPQSIAAPGTAIFGGTSTIIVGGVSGTAFTTPCTYYRAQVYRAGALVVDFNAQDYVSGGTWASSTTGETWTKNGNALIVNSPLLGYSEWQAATNLALQSTFAGIWTTANATLTTNAILAPDGTVTAAKIAETAVTGAHGVVQAYTKAASALAYTFACSLRQGEDGWGILELNDGSTNGYRQWFNLATGALGSAVILGAGWTLPSATITPSTNGFFRVTFTVTTSTATVLNSNVLASTGDTVYSYAGVAGNGIYAWGAQVEQNAFATPYIPTTTVAATRNADLPTYPLAGNASNTVGSAYAEVSSGWSGTLANQVVLSLTDATGQPLVPQTSTGTSIYDGTAPVAKTGLTDLFTGMRKRASVWDVRTATMKVTGDGVTPASGTFDGTMGPGTGNVNIGSTGAGNFFNGNIRNVKIWKTALSDAALQRLTT